MFLSYPGERKFLLSEEDEEELQKDILPYWRAEGNYERTPCGHLHHQIANLFYADPLQFPADGSLIGSNGTYYQDVGHQVIDYAKVLKMGYRGVQKEAERRLAQLDPADPDHLRMIPFVRAVVIAMGGAAEIGKRFADKARELAQTEKSTARKRELLTITEVCHHVPANPARTFYEALQSYWFTYILQYWESMEAKCHSMGRMDQYLYPYYETDLREGRLTREDPQELIDCWLVKVPNVSWQMDDLHFYVVGDLVLPHLSVGGLKPDGSDATNEISYMFIESMMHLRLPEPDFSVLVHGKTPDDFLIKGCQLAALGSGQPMFQNSDFIVNGLLARGNLNRMPVSLEDARNAVEVGCQEPFIPGKDGIDITPGFTNVALALEFALNNGIKRVCSDNSGPIDWEKAMAFLNVGRGIETGDPRRFKSFEEVKEAYCRQVTVVVRNKLITHKVRDMSLAELKPTIFQSALIDDCLEKGMCREAGGARYNWGPGIYASGLADVADSLTAIKKVVFDEKKITMDRLCDALDKNFEGYEDVRKMLLQAPKYGNDDDYADEMMAWAMHQWATEVSSHKNLRGGYAVPGLQSLFVTVPYGRAVGALPSGRLAGMPISNGGSPCNGAAVNGPTAIINSLGKLDNLECNLGIVLNIRMNPTVFMDSFGLRRLAALVRAIVDKMVMHIQFNVVSSDVLRAAQKEPEKYKDVVVRVAGYSAFFVNLSKGLQEEVIARQEWGNE
jgi:formate C-acetyltransferase